MLEELKLLIGIDGLELDPKLNLILSMTTTRLKRLLGGIEPPESMNDVIVNVAVKRYNRIGSEGLSSHSVEGESLSFTDDDFSEFTDEIQTFLESQQESSRGRVRFL